MSADDWQQCPKCIKDREAELARVNELETRINRGVRYTLRLDYEIGVIDDNPLEFFYDFKARCTVCGWGFDRHHREDISCEQN